MRTSLSFALGLALSTTMMATGCGPAAPTVQEGGANANDRTFGGEPGEQLLTGVMEVTPSGRFAVLQRNTVTVILDVEAESYVELPQQLARIALSKTRDVGYALANDGALAALDLATGDELWRADATFADVSWLRVTDDDGALVVADGATLTILETADGSLRGTAELPSTVSFGELLPKSARAMVVGHTTWNGPSPSTPVVLVDLATAAQSSVSVPNCEAPPAVLPDESRALLSPTYCEFDRASNPDDAWTNPDPVSVIDVGETGLSFVKNLPGFGPVALSHDGARAVAYLDTKRVDPSMFADKSQIPAPDGREYHILVIDPKTLAFTVTPIGDALPRFAMSRDGKGLLVDASIKVVHRAQAHADANLSVSAKGISGEISASAAIFDDASPFGWFDLETRAFTGFRGPQAGLDRFVQLADDKTVVTLQKRADGLGGIPFTIDLETKTTAVLGGDYGTGVRDIGLLPDGATIVLRFRQPAAQIGNQLFARETYCLSLDGIACASGRIEYQATVAFATADTNDCASMGHDCW